MTALDMALALLLLPLGLAALRQCALWVLGPGPPAGSGEPVPRETVTVLVPAHDEAPLLPGCLDSLDGQTLPADRRTVVVLADRCSDETAQIARGRGLRVLERREGPAGKGPLLDWALDQLGKAAREGPVAVLDADSAASPGWLAASLARLDRGAAEAHPVTAVQAHHGVRPRRLGALERLMAASARARRRILGARERLGLAAPLLGTGMVFAPGVLAHGWTEQGLVEDREMGVRLVLEGDRPAFLATQEILSEPPGNLQGARIQRLRWMRGELDLTLRSLPGLLRELARGDLRAGELALELLLPSPAIRLALIAALWLAAAALALGGLADPGLSLAPVTAVLALEALPRALHLLADGPAGWGALLGAPFFVAWKAGLGVRSLLRPDRRWRSTRQGPAPGGDRA